MFIILTDRVPHYNNKLTTKIALLYCFSLSPFLAFPTSLSLTYSLFCLLSSVSNTSGISLRLNHFCFSASFPSSSLLFHLHQYAPQASHFKTASFYASSLPFFLPQTRTQLTSSSFFCLSVSNKHRASFPCVSFIV